MPMGTKAEARKKAVLSANREALEAQAEDVASLMMATQRMMAATMVRGSE